MVWARADAVGPWLCQGIEDFTWLVPAETQIVVVAKDRIPSVIRTFRDAVCTGTFPGRTDVPKTLIFAKADRHAQKQDKAAQDVPHASPADGRPVLFPPGGETRYDCCLTHCTVLDEMG